MKLILATVVLFAFTGCKTEPVGCTLEKSATSLLAATITTQLSCKNLDAVKTDVQAQLVKLNLCVQPTPTATPAAGITTQGALGDLVCKPVVDGLMSGVLGQIPTSWECSGGAVGDAARQLLMAECKKAL